MQIQGMFWRLFDCRKTVKDNLRSEVEVLNLCKNRGRLVLHSVGSEKIVISQKPI